MKNVSLFFIYFIVLSCATMSEEVDLYEYYNNYVRYIKTNNTLFAETMLSKQLREKIKLSDKDDFPILSGFPGVLSEVKNHYQSFESNKGCLSINGYDENSAPVSLYIEYSNENNQWLVAYVEIFYPDTAKEFKNFGVCPTQFQ